MPKRPVGSRLRCGIIGCGVIAPTHVESLRQQEDVAANAREISQVGKELYDRLSTFVSHFENIGKGLRGASNAYDSAVGSLERMVLPSSRKLKDLHATTKAEIASPTRLETEVRQITAEELKSPPPDGQHDE